MRSGQCPVTPGELWLFSHSYVVMPLVRRNERSSHGTKIVVWECMVYRSTLSKSSNDQRQRRAGLESFEWPDPHFKLLARAP